MDLLLKSTLLRDAPKYYTPNVAPISFDYNCDCLLPVSGIIQTSQHTAQTFPALFFFVLPYLPLLCNHDLKEVCISHI